MYVSLFYQNTPILMYLYNEFFFVVAHRDDDYDARASEIDCDDSFIDDEGMQAVINEECVTENLGISFFAKCHT